MPLQPSRGLFEISFLSAFAHFCTLISCGLAPTPLASESVTEQMASIRATASLPAELQGREPNFNQNLQSELKFNLKTSKNHDRLASDLYYDSPIHTYNKYKDRNISEFDRAAESESSLRWAIGFRNRQDAPGREPTPPRSIENRETNATATTAQLPNRGEDRREINIPNPGLPTPAPLPEPTPPAPRPSPEQLLRLTAPPRIKQQELLNIPGTIGVERFEVIGSTVFSKTELDAVLKDFAGRPLTFAELLQARSAVSQLYISKGYITSGAIVPPQTLSGGIVRILVLEGKLESIKVVWTKRLHPNYIRSRLARATKGPLNEQRLLEALQLLQAGGQLQNISAQLQAGSRPGFNVLWVKVKEAQTFQTNLFTDNSRSPSVGSWRRGWNSRKLICSVSEIVRV